MTHKQKVLRLLSDHKPHSHHELYDLNVIGHSRISDLRRDGHNIEQWRENGHYWYRLVGALEEASLASMAGGVSSSASSPETPRGRSTAEREGALQNREGAEDRGGSEGASTPTVTRGTVAPPGALVLFDTPRGAYGD